MTLKNLWFNFRHGVIRAYKYDCYNIGILIDEGGPTIVKFDWHKPFKYITKKEEIKYDKTRIYRRNWPSGLRLTK